MLMPPSYKKNEGTKSVWSCLNVYPCYFLANCDSSRAIVFMHPFVKDLIFVIQRPDCTKMFLLHFRADAWRFAMDMSLFVWTNYKILEDIFLFWSIYDKIIYCQFVYEDIWEYTILRTIRYSKHFFLCLSLCNFTWIICTKKNQTCTFTCFT